MQKSGGHLSEFLGDGLGIQVVAEPRVSGPLGQFVQ
jgi:hypothetical protein